MIIYIVRYEDDDNKSVSFHSNIKDASKGRTKIKRLFELGDKRLDEVIIEKVSIGRNKSNFLDLFNEYGISTLHKL